MSGLYGSLQVYVYGRDQCTIVALSRVGVSVTKSNVHKTGVLMSIKVLPKYKGVASLECSLTLWESASVRGAGPSPAAPIRMSEKL